MTLSFFRPPIRSRFGPHSHREATNHDGLPAWPPYSVDERSTMIVDDRREMVADPFREERLVVEGG